jgi:hypothetical protein
MEAWKWVLLVALLVVLLYSLYIVGNMTIITASDASGNKLSEYSQTKRPSHKHRYGDGYYL